MECERTFKGIWIPKEIWLSKELTMQEKIMLVEIESLDNERGCFAGNQYFADFFGISKTRVSLVIGKLIAKGWINRDIIYKENSKEILNRALRINRPPYPSFIKETYEINVIDPMQQKLKGVYNKSYRPYTTNVNDPIQQKLKDNNTINNTVNNTIYNKSNEKFYEDEKVEKYFLEYLKIRIKLKLSNEKIVISRLKNFLSNYSDEMKVLVLEKAITNNWKDLYPLKDEDLKLYSNNKKEEKNTSSKGGTENEQWADRKFEWE